MKSCILVLIFCLAACGHKTVDVAAASADSRYDVTFSAGGLERHFTLFKPAQCAGKVSPVLIAIHGRGGCPANMLDDYKLKETAVKHGFIIIAPAAVDEEWFDVRPGADQERDRAFFKEIFARIPGLGGDPQRTYVAGFSNGGGMTFWLASQYSDKIAAIAGGGASIGVLDIDLKYYEFEAPKHPIPVLMFHGTEDPICGYDMRSFGVPIPEAAAWWAECDHITAKPEHSERKGGLFTDEWRGNDLSVKLMSFRGMTHKWPGELDAQTGINFDEELWSFVSKYQLP